MKDSLKILNNDSIFNINDGIGTFKNIRKVTLKLGYRCNMQCNHCCQSDEKDSEISLSFSSETEKFIFDYIVYSLKNEIKNKPNIILFYGGEPLLYWDIIKSIILHYFDIFGMLNVKKIQFAIVTNGLLLSEDVIEFLNKYNIRLIFSYDAPYPFAVRGYVPQSICELANKIKYLQIISTGSSFNCDPLLAYYCLKRKFPNAEYKIRLEILRISTDMIEEVDNYDIEKLRVSIHKLFIAAKLGDVFALDYLRDILERLFSNDMEKFFHEHVGLCVTGYKDIAISLDGKVYLCDNSNYVIGNISEPLLELFKRSCSYWKSIYNGECDSCEYNKYCIGTCALFIKDKEGKYITCKKFKKKFWSVFLKEFKELKKPLSENDKKWFEIEKNKMLSFAMKY